MKPSDQPPAHVGQREDDSPRVHERHRDPSRSGARTRRIARNSALLALVVAVYVLHQDFWNWRRIDPMLFGFIPVGLTYHIAYSFAVALMMGVLVKFAWPAHLEKFEPGEPSSPDRHPSGKS
jgi:hypothetical protein